MHPNVRAACRALSISSYENAKEAAEIIPSLIQMSCRGGARYNKVTVGLDDVALLCCEYTCIVKEVGGLGFCTGSPAARQSFLLSKLPCSLEEAQQSRRALHNSLRRSSDVSTGLDDARARNMLQRYLSTRTGVCRNLNMETFPPAMEASMYCTVCGGLLEKDRRIDPRATKHAHNCQADY